MRDIVILNPSDVISTDIPASRELGRAPGFRTDHALYGAGLIVRIRTVRPIPVRRTPSPNVSGRPGDPVSGPMLRSDRSCPPSAFAWSPVRSDLIVRRVVFRLYRRFEGIAGSDFGSDIRALFAVNLGRNALEYVCRSGSTGRTENEENENDQ